MDTGNGSGGTGTLGPHRLSQVLTGPTAATYAYDARGNQTVRDAAGTANDRSVSFPVKQTFQK